MACTWLSFICLKQQQCGEIIFTFIKKYILEISHLPHTSITLPPSLPFPRQFDAEFRRFSVDREKYERLEDFRQLVEDLHRLANTAFVLAYTDPRDGDLLPLTNDDNFRKALQCARPLLRIIVQHKGELAMLYTVGVLVVLCDCG